jgi:hypothetical protein
MLFATLVFISAFLIESIGSYISIVGLSALFSTNPVIIILALSLDIAKVITVSFLYKQWKNIPRTMKYYMTAAAVILMIITSSGAAGYLSAEFQKAIIPTKGSEIQVKAMTEEKTRLESRKVEIDKQISQLPPENVRGRQKLQKQFAGELDHINTRIIEIDQELPKLQMEQVDVNAHAGPILYIAQAFDTTVESAVKYVILLIIFVFDPLAVALIIAGNFLLDQKRKEEKDLINAKLDEIKHEVQHIEKEIEDMTVQEQTKEVFECVQPVPVEEQKGTEIEALPEFVVDEEAFLRPEPAESVVEQSPAFDAAAFEECDQAIEEAAQESEAQGGLVELVVESEVPVQTETGPKKKRGRKPKDESEPKPSITTDEQLSEVVHVESLEPVIEAVEAVDAEEIPEVEEVNPIHLSDLNKISHHAADVSFDATDDDGSWKPSKKVMNIYNKID